MRLEEFEKQINDVINSKEKELDVRKNKLKRKSIRLKYL